MTQEEKAKAYDEALEKARKRVTIEPQDHTDAILKDIFPQLAESEDEKMLREIKRYIKEQGAKPTGLPNGIVSVSDMIAWLEKRKEQFEEPKIAFGDWGDEEKKEAIITCLKYMRFVKKITNQEYDDLVKWLDNNLVSNVLEKGECLREVEQEEQKPVESISQLTVQGKGVYKICPRCKERMVRDDSMIYTSMPPQYRYECPKCGESECDTVMYDNPEMKEQKPVVTHGETYHVDTLGTQQVIAGKMPQKPAEWSPTKEQMVALSWAANGMLDNDSPSAGDIKASLRTLYNDLQSKSIRPAEWSEKDEKTIDDAYCWLCEYAGSLIQRNYGKSSMLYGIANKLKSLHPQPKPEWSKEDEANRTFILESLEDQIRFCKKDTKGAYYTKQIRIAQNWLKSLSLNLKKKNEDVAKLCSNE